MKVILLPRAWWPLVLILLVRAATPCAVAQDITLVPVTNVWRYNQDGVDLSGQFNQIIFNDAAWPQGQGLLGLETSAPYPYPFPIRTPLTVGGGRITYYFRTHFNLASSPDGVTLRASVFVDDGAVLYLNGAEAGRVNMPVGAVDGSTLAGLANEGQKQSLDFPAASLAQGDNVLAVEVHQTAANSSDIVFGMTLTATPPASGPIVILAQPANRIVEEGLPVSFAIQVIGTPPYFYQWLKNGMPIPGATNVALTFPAAAAGDAGNYSVTVSNLFSVATSANAMLAVTPAPVEIIRLTNVWRYNATGVDPGAGWRQSAFNDSAWPAGAGLLYNESAALPGPKNSLLPLTAGGQPIITYYFRTHFHWPGSTANAVLTARILIDDGAVFHLNGAEAARYGMFVPPSPVTHTTLANLDVGDANRFQVISLAATNLVPGDNVLAVEVHQKTASSTDVVFGLALGTNFILTLPDLILWGPSAGPSVTSETFAPDDCEVNEGCATPGTRRLLRFGTETRNIGTADLFLGDPAGNPLFEYDDCHGHYHFHDFAAYRLFDSNNVEVAVGNKVGFCLLDLTRWDPAANDASVYDCDYQGIQVGWGDIYSDGLPCQYIDITTLPPGTYTLEMEIDPENRIAELDELNNITRLTVDIDVPCSRPPPNDDFANARALTQRVVSATEATACADKEPAEPDHYGNSGGSSIWYRWTAPYSGPVVIHTEGSSFDTLLAVYRGTALNALNEVAADDDSGAGVTSRIATNVVAGTIYHIAVDGYGGDTGDTVLNINPNGNDNFANCILLTNLSSSLFGYSAEATREVGEPLHAGNPGGSSIWYCWTAPVAGLVSIDTIGSRFDTLLAVYTGNSVSSLAPVASDNDGGPNRSSRVVFNAIAGMNYRIAIDGLTGSGGLAALNWGPVLRFGQPVSSGGVLRLPVLSRAGERCMVETSADLLNWTTWGRVTNSTGALELTDPIGAGPRFYRLRTE